MNDPQWRNRRGSLVWPVMLIGLGIIFLLNNLGVLDWEIWFTIIRLWPLLLIVVGLDILLGRRSGIWTAISIVIIIAVFAGGVWLVQTTSSVFSGDRITQSFSEPVGAADKAEVDITFGVGVLELGGLTASEYLAQGKLDLTEDERLEQEYYLVGETAFLRLDSSGQQVYPSWLIHDVFDDPRTWKIDLTGAIPIDLRVRSGVGKSVIDVRDLELIGLKIESGVGETIVHLPNHGQFTARVSAGVGELKVYVPSNLAFRIHLDIGLGNTSVTGVYQQVGNVYISPGFDTAENWVELYMDGGIGDIRVIQLDN